jgi:DNA-binding transcriptional LysR family regulator
MEGSMDLKELITFRTIIQQGTFSKSAMKLNYAQSTITNQIQRLERELGILLFKRGWDAELTPAGKIFAEEVDKLIAHWNFVSDQAKSLQKEEIGQLNIGIMETIAIRILPTIIERFHNLKPKITCEVTIGNTEFLSNILDQNLIDFAVCSESKKRVNLIFEPLFNEKISFIVSQNHSLAKEEKLTLEELYKHPLLIGDRTCLYRLKLEKEFSKFNKNPFYYSISQISAIPLFLDKLSGVGAVPSSLPLKEDIIRIPVELINNNIPIGILQNSKNQYISATKKLFLQILKEELSLLNRTTL